MFIGPMLSLQFTVNVPLLSESDKKFIFYSELNNEGFIGFCFIFLFNNLMIQI